MTFKAPDSLAEQIAHHLAERIIRGELKAGERIQEQKVTQALNVSRGSPAISRTYYLALERRKDEKGHLLDTFAALLQAIFVRDHQMLRQILLGYSERNCQLLLAASAER